MKGGIKQITGWMLPDKTFVECPIFQHVRAIMVDARFAPLMPSLEGCKAEIARTEQECMEAQETQGACHAEWHVHEAAVSDAGWQLRADLYESGCFRVGCRVENTGEIEWSGGYGHAIKQNVMHFEGTTDALLASHDALVCFAKLAGYEHTKMEPVNLDALRG